MDEPVLDASGIFFFPFENGVGMSNGCADVWQETMLDKLCSDFDGVGKTDLVSTTMRFDGDSVQAQKNRPVISATTTSSLPLVMSIPSTNP